MRNVIQTLTVIIVIAAGMYIARDIQRMEPSTGMHADAHSAEMKEPARGSHGGRLLTQDNFQLELTLFEHGVEPEFRVYAYENERPVNPAEIDLTITLNRLGGNTDVFRFSPREDYLKGDGVVSEPHSFDVTVEAVNAGEVHRWQYSQYEGRTVIAGETALDAGIATAIAGPAEISRTLILQGTVTYDANLIRRVMARYPGVLHVATRTIGNHVQAGDVLAQVESNDSLQTYDIKAPVSGIIIEQQVMPGETTADKPIYVIANMNKVWVDLAVFRRDLPRVSTGQQVQLSSLDGTQHVEATIGYIAPASSSSSQSTVARVYLDNTDGRWRPGMAVNGTVILSKQEVPLAVRNSALQKFRDFDVVYARFGDTFEVRMLDLGISDGNYTEVTGGIDPGTDYVVENSYLIKADIEKSGASHDH